MSASHFPAPCQRFGRYFHKHYRLQRRGLSYARRYPKLYTEPTLATAIERLRKESISVFSFPDCERFEALEVAVRIDDDGFPWVDHSGRRLYFRRGTDLAAVTANYRRLGAEQHSQNGSIGTSLLHT